MFKNKLRNYSSIRFALVVCLIALIMSGCGDETPTRTPLPTLILGGPTVTPSPVVEEGLVYDFQDDVLPAQREQIKKGISLAIKAFGPVSSVNIVAKNSHNNFFEKADDETLGSAVPREILLKTSDSEGERPSETQMLITTIHEYYHIVQFSQAGITWAEFALYSADTSNLRPEWLVEGSAEYMAYKVMADNNLYPSENIRARKIRDSARGRYPLSSLESYRSVYSNAPYSVGFMATEYLMSNYGGATALARYWKAIKSELKWQTAFQSSFGVSVGDFYAKFESWRSKQFPRNQP